MKTFRAGTSLGTVLPPRRHPEPHHSGQSCVHCWLPVVSSWSE